MQARQRLLLELAVGASGGPSAGRNRPGARRTPGHRRRRTASCRPPLTRQPPHMPVPSTMIGLSETMVRTPQRLGQVRPPRASSAPGRRHRRRRSPPAASTSWPARRSRSRAARSCRRRCRRSPRRSAPQLLLEDHPLPRAAADDAESRARRGAAGPGRSDAPRPCRRRRRRRARGRASISSVGWPSGPATSRMASPGSSATSSCGALADRLDDQRDGARVRVGVGDGQRDALGALAAAHDDELAGLADLRDARAPRRPAG